MTQAEQEMAERLRLLLRLPKPEPDLMFEESEPELPLVPRSRSNMDALLQILNNNLNKWNGATPKTNIASLDELAQDFPAWKVAILWGALAEAVMSWMWSDIFGHLMRGEPRKIPDEDLEKYRDIRRNAEAQWAKCLGAKAGFMSRPAGC